METRHNKLIICAIWLLLIADLLIAQTPDFKKRIAMISSSPKGAQWIHFKSDSRIKAEDLFTVDKTAMGLSVDDSMAEIRSDLDTLGYTHHRFQQKYKGIKVEGAEFIVHSRNEQAEKANGKIVTGLQLDVQPAISSDDAVQSALNEMKAEEYMWEDSDAENFLKMRKRDQNATYYPEARLLITRVVNSRGFAADNFVLAYRCDVYSKIPYDAAAIYVNAHSGRVFKKVSLRPTCSTANARTLFNGKQKILTQYNKISEKYTLQDNCRGSGVITYYNGKELDEKDNQWNDSDKEKRAATAHWSTEMAYDYYLEKHNRNSYNNHAAAMFSDVDPSYKDNAAWDPEAEYVRFGKGTKSDMDYIVAIDVVGHEWTHAVTQYTAGLEYESESGALDESFSDIFGTMVEFFAQGGEGDYLIGEDIWAGPGKYRSMRNPNDESQPDTYDGDYWINTSGCNPNGYNDLCGVHTNSGVQNYWFYLLAEGGSGKNDNGYSFSVTTIGREKAAAIAYRNLTYYLTSTSDYFDARTGSTWAAIDLYRLPSTEVTQVVNAWFAVDVVDGDNLILLIRDPLDTDAVYVAAESITAGLFEVANEGRVLMYAGSKITLSPGFSATSGSEFHAFINPAFSSED